MMESQRHLKISVTTLDSFNNYLNDKLAEDELIKILKGEFKGNFYTERGTALHKINVDNITTQIPIFDKDGVDIYEYNDLIFDKAGIDKIATFIDHRSIPELKTFKDYEINGITFRIVGKADFWTPQSIIEIKSTSYFNPETYDESYQWRFYMDIFDVKEVLYIIATLTERGGIQYIEHINCLLKLWYDSIPAEIEDLLFMFIYFIKYKGLEWIYS